MTRKFRIQMLHARKYLFCAMHCLRRKRGRRNMDIFDLFGFWILHRLQPPLSFIFIMCMLCIDFDCSRDFCLPRCGCAFHANLMRRCKFFSFSLFSSFSSSSPPPHSFPIRSVVVAVECDGRHSRCCKFFFLYFLFFFSFSHEMRTMWTDVIHTVDVFISKKVDAIF